MMDQFFQNISLPKVSKGETLETISRNALVSYFPPERFEVRHEREREKGIDITFEIVKDGEYTNFRFIAQVKSSHSIKRNSDDSFSVRIAVSNVNYLMNNAMPAFYFFYDANSEEFYALDVREVCLQLVKKYKDQKYPKSFSARFSQRLTAELIETVYLETLKTGTFFRQLTPLLHEESPGGTTAVVIDQNSRVFSVNENITFLEQHGIYLMNEAKFSLIIDIEQRSHPRGNTSAIFNYICGTAYYFQGNFFKALDFFRNAYQGIETLHPELQSLLRHNFLEAKYVVGLLSRDEFKAAMFEVYNDAQLGSYLQLQRAFSKLFDKEENNENPLAMLCAEVQAILAREPDNVQARIVGYARVLAAERTALVNDMIGNIIGVFLRVDDFFSTETYTEWLSNATEQTDRLRQLTDYAQKVANSIAFGNLFCDCIRWDYRQKVILHILKNWNRKKLTVTKPIGEEQITGVKKNLNSIKGIIELYEQLGHVENLVHSLIQQHDMECFIQDHEAAHKTQQRINEIIEKHEARGLREQFDEYCNANSEFETFYRLLVEPMAEIQRSARAFGAEKFLYMKSQPTYLSDYNPVSVWTNSSLMPLHFPHLSAHEQLESQ